MSSVFDQKSSQAMPNQATDLEQRASAHASVHKRDLSNEYIKSKYAPKTDGVLYQLNKYENKVGQDHKSSNRQIDN